MSRLTTRKVSEGTRTPDRLDHNQELYQLSYAHQGALNLAADRAAIGGAQAPHESLNGQRLTRPAP